MVLKLFKSVDVWVSKEIIWNLSHFVGFGSELWSQEAKGEQTYFFVFFPELEIQKSILYIFCHSNCP